MDPSNKDIRRLGEEVVAAATADQLTAITEWAKEMLRIRESNGTILQKAKLAIGATADRKALGPLMDVAWRELRRIGWTERGLPARIAIGAAVASLTLTGQGAGIAALGGAIGVPLFVVFGAGGALAGVIIDEVRKKQDP
jgi:hypothetical protein